ncbi:MAG: F0F1 ATP synthase subunit delta [Patescibacteria group bacterium]|jgi:F0F1-type ATP synthase delta subunit
MKYSARIYAETWFSSLSEAPNSDWAKLSTNYLQHIYRHGHIKWLPEIVRLIAELEHKKNGTTPVVVTTAHNADENLVKQLTDKILPNTTVVIEQRVDPAMLGGIKLATSNQRWDASVLGHLNHLAHSLSL